MTATAIDATTRYYAVGTRQWYWVTTIANKNSPTRSELDAGTDLTPEVAAVDGFTSSSDNIDAPDYGNRFVSQVQGRITADDSSITLYASSDSDDVRTLIAEDDAGFVVVFPEGDVATHKMDVWPVQAKSVSMPTSDSDAGQVVIQFSITSVPAKNVTVPADS